MSRFSTPFGPITVERASAADVDAVLAVLNRAGEWVTARGIDQWGPGHFSRERGLAAIGRGEAYVARLGGKVVATLRLQWSDEALWGDRPSGAGYVHALAVDRAYAGHGIGLGLLRWAEAQVAAEGREWLRLDCMAANPALRDYYLKAGFTFMGEARKHGWAAALFEREVGGLRGGTVLETDRLTLRVFRPDDLDAFAPIEADPEVMRFYPSGPRPREWAERGVRYFMGLQERHGFSPWAVIHKSEDRFIGYCGLLPQTIDGQDEVEVGYKLARDAWGRGLATEAARACRDWGFRNLAVPRLVSIIDPGNAASVRVAQKNGMRHEKDAEYDGKTCRIYAVSREEWERREGGQD